MSELCPDARDSDTGSCPPHANAAAAKAKGIAGTRRRRHVGVGIGRGNVDQISGSVLPKFGVGSAGLPGIPTALVGLADVSTFAVGGGQ
jgi:hypothetical protein